MTLLVIAVVLAFVAAGAPLFAVFAALSLGLFAGVPDTPLSSVANDTFSEKFADSPLLVTIPLFTFAGVLLSASRAPARLVEVARALFGWVPGGLAIVCLVTSAVFTTFTGGSGVTIVAIGALLFPALISERYGEKFSLGLVTTGGSLGVLFPPSVPVILYGVVGGVDIEGLFLAALVPGLLTVLVLAGYSGLIGARKTSIRTRFDPKLAARALWTAKWEVLLPLVLTTGLALGLLRIHEAAAFTALYVLVIEVAVYRDISLKDLPKIARECVVLVGAILIILVAALGLTAYLIQTNVPQAALDWMRSWVSSRAVFLVTLNAFLFVVGMTMDVFSAIVVVVPLIAPLAAHFGLNPYHLGAIFLLNLEVGYLTPPLGLNLFISGFRFERPLSVVYGAVVPFILLLVLTLGLVTYVPALSTWGLGRIAPPLTLGAPAPVDVSPAAAASAPTTTPQVPHEETLEDLLRDEAPLFPDEKPTTPTPP